MAILNILKLFVQGARPKTLMAAICPVIFICTSFYISDGVIYWDVVLYSMLSLSFIQMGTNFFNDYYDFKKGADGADRLGPERLTSQLKVSPSLVRNFAFISFGVAILFAAPLLYEGGLGILAVGVLSLLAGYMYTGGPYPFAYHGLGEIMVLLFYGGVSVTGLSILYRHQLSLNDLATAAQVGLLATSLITINNLRDLEQDKKNNKNTFIVKIGRKMGILFLAICLIAPYILYFFKGLLVDWPLFIPLIMALIILLKIIKTPPSTLYNKYLAMTGAHFLLFTLTHLFYVLYFV